MVNLIIRGNEIRSVEIDSAQSIFDLKVNE